MSTCALTGNTFSYFPLCWNVMNHRAVWQDKCTKTKLFDQVKSDCELSWPDVVLELLEPQDSESHGDQEPKLKSLTVTHTRGVTMGEKTHPHTHTPRNICVCCCVCVCFCQDKQWEVRLSWTSEQGWGEGWEEGSFTYSRRGLLKELCFQAFLRMSCIPRLFSLGCLKTFMTYTSKT